MSGIGAERGRAACHRRAPRRVGYSSHKGILPPKNPPKNLAPVPNFYADCALGALDDDRGVQRRDRAGNRPRPWPRAARPTGFNLQKFLRLSVTDQLFTIADLERVSRGEPPMVALTTQLDNVAKTGRGGGEGPRARFAGTVSGGAAMRAWGSNFADGTESALGADYGWMYDDGYGGFNYDCPTRQGAWVLGAQGQRPRSVVERPRRLPAGRSRAF